MSYRSPLRTIVFLCLSLCFLVTLSLGATAQSESDYEKQLNNLATTIDKLQKELEKTKTSRDKLKKSLQKSEEDISALNKKIKTIKEALAREKKQLSQHQSKRADLETSRKEQQVQINQIVQQAYQLGRQSQVKLLLNQEAPYRVTRLLRYHDYIVAAHKEKMDVYLETIQSINTVEQTILASTERLEAHQLQLNTRYQELKDSQQQRLTTLATLNQELRDKGGELSELKSDQARLERLLEEATRALSEIQLPSNAKAFQSVKGKLPYPTKGKIRHHYGSARLNGKLRWNGLFIGGKLGDKVVSVHHGRVIFSDYLRGHGLLLIIDHGDGYMSLYAHNQTLLKDTGDWVSSGETIATLGNTGGQSQTGLYFEIRHKGKPQNPKPWLSRG